MYVHDDAADAPFRDALRTRGVHLFDVEQTGQLTLQPTTSLYGAGSAFDGPATVAAFAAAAEAARADDYSGLWVAGSANWAGSEPATTAALLDYEALVDPVLHGQGVTAMCLYDRALFANEHLCSAARNHPVVGHGGRSYVNPLFRAGLGAAPTTAGDLDALLRDMDQVDRILARHDPNRNERRDRRRRTHDWQAVAPALPYVVACCQCGDIRDGGPGDVGQRWMRGWRWLAERLGAEVSHGYCPGCYAAVMDEMNS